MDDLVDFLQARLDEDEQAAKAVPPGPWRWVKHEGDPDGDWEGLQGDDDSVVLSSSDTETYQSWIDKHDGLDSYLPLLDPARVLREIEAKRRLLQDADEYCAEYDAEIDDDNSAAQRAYHWRLTLCRNLAVAYADRLGYKPGWAPEESGT